MLYEFHRKQNAKKPGAVHATYLLSGTRSPSLAQANGVHSQDGEDAVMQSSPLMPSSSAPQPDDGIVETIPVRSVMLVKEEHLERAKALFDTISSIHIYSLEASSPSDIHVLTECNRKVAASYATEDPLQAWKQYGTIQNPNVKRRTRRTIPLPAAPIAKDADAKTKPLAPITKSTEAKTVSRPSSAKDTPEPEKKSVTKPTAPKRQSSDIFKSFSKAKTQPKKEASQSSAEASPAPEPEDEPMGGFSEDEADEDVPDQTEAESDAPAGKSKKEREADLQAMMDQEDEPMEDVPTPAEDSQEVAEPIDAAESQAEEQPKETVTVENGRRRGRRRVMKKKTVKDEEGYLGTLVTRDIDFAAAYTNWSQSRKKKQHGSRSPKTSPRRRKSKYRQLRLSTLATSRLRRKEASRVKVTSCRSSERIKLDRPSSSVILYVLCSCLHRHMVAYYVIPFGQCATYCASDHCNLTVFRYRYSTQ